MTIKRLKAPTLEEVQRTINAMEREFQVSSADFQKPEIYTSIPEEAAADWHFALQQHAVLAQMYWKAVSGPQRRVRCDDRSYQESVAA
jgi:hypothetical protein